MEVEAIVYDLQLPRACLQSATLEMQSSDRSSSGARTALGLLLAINLFNFIDRYVLASVEPEIRAHFFAADDPHAHLLSGSLGSGFLWSYMVSSLIFGWVADRFSRWVIIGIGV